MDKESKKELTVKLSRAFKQRAVLDLIKELNDFLDSPNNSPKTLLRILEGHFCSLFAAHIATLSNEDTLKVLMLLTDRIMQLRDQSMDLLEQAFGVLPNYD